MPALTPRLRSWHRLHELATKFDNTKNISLEDDQPQLLSESGIVLDYSKNRIGGEIFNALASLFTACNTLERAQQLSQGHHLNNTEERPALHTAIRAATNGLDAPNAELIRTQYAKTTAFADKLYRGELTGSSGKPITDVVNIGIGGSDLGPRMATAALAEYSGKQTTVHYVSSLDSFDLKQILGKLSARTTLFLISSKSFNTEETLCNAKQAIRWFEESYDEGDLRLHFAAITGNPEKALTLGIAEDRIFMVPDWIGGRYSIWSDSGLPVMIAIGAKQFGEMLSGAQHMDQHALYNDFNQNIPAIMAAIEIWNTNFLGYQSLAIVPYSHPLRLLPSYLQQLIMESNGKSVTREGEPVHWLTSPVIWGTAGTEGQHSYHQLLHQGTFPTPVDFILPLGPIDSDEHIRLASHCLAQSKALMEGKTAALALKELLEQGLPEPTARALAPHKAMPGNRPSNTLILDRLSPFTLGALLALYEHKTFFTSVIWDINPFDQWGVELGKQLSSEIYERLKCNQNPDFDPSTNALINCIRSLQGRGY